MLLPCDDPEWSKFTRFFAENFELLGLKKLISTSYVAASKKFFNAEAHRRGGGRAGVPRTPSWYQPTLFEQESPQFDEKKTAVRGKIFVLDHDTNANGRIDLDDLEWKYLEGDGDFRSEEVCKLRDEADVIVTNPPFSLFREFLAWILGTDGEGNLTQRRGEAESEEGVLATKNAKSAKQFLIIGNMNATTTKDVFPLFMRNDLWMGESIHSGDREFGVPKEYPLDAAGWRVDENGNHFIRVKGVRWFTNLEHGRRHQPLELMAETLVAMIEGSPVAGFGRSGRAGVPPPAADGDGTPSLPARSRDTDGDGTPSLPGNTIHPPVVIDYCIQHLGAMVNELDDARRKAVRGRVAG